MSTRTRWRILAAIVLVAPTCSHPASAADERQFAYAELEGVAEDYRYIREWRSYYWREDFTFVLVDDQGRRTRVISREPTPWNNLRFGTTYPPSQVDWKAKPRVRVIGVAAVDRQPAEFYDVQLDPEKTVTAFIVRTQTAPGAKWQDYYVNNWFHKWGPEADGKVVAQYAVDDPHYTIYGYLAGISVPFDAASQQILDAHKESYGGIIHHSRVVKRSDGTYELHAIHFVGRNKKTANYEAFHGDYKALIPLDQRKPTK